ncbi:hypothetical protein HOY82DRAFT_647045 [Tuber indicum]|nr:hypothetical protein HOY82DRAFT_647045 [Tuber indicum]
MSSVSTEHSLLATFDSILEPGVCVSPDNEFLPSLFDPGEGCSGAGNAGMEFACPSGACFSELPVGQGSSEPHEPTKTEPTESNEVANVERKKRKSWGEELPILTTNLPPRKRAKTEDEKEQRRIEQILRNRAAARSSRERKEKHAEALKEETKGLAESNDSLRDRLAVLEESNKELHQQLGALEQILKRYQEQMGVAPCDFNTNALARPAHPQSPPSLWGVPELSVGELENTLSFLDTMQQPPATTIDPSVLGGPIGPGWGEIVIGSGYIIS